MGNYFFTRNDASCCCHRAALPLSDIEDEEKEKNLFYSQGGSVILALLSIISSQPQLYAKLSKLRGLLAASQK